MLAIQQPANWPRIWASDAEAELKDRLRRLSLLRPGTLGGITDDIAQLIGKGPELVSQIAQIVDKAQEHLPTITAALQDPALPALVSRVQTLQAMEAAKSSPASTPADPNATPPATGVGLHRVIPLFDAAIWYEKYPYAPWLIGAGAIVVLGGIGFGIGRWTARRRGTQTASYRRR